ncbi:MAG: 50S ribosomal protein L18 [Patescibacteria group bacterium]|nr:MAG: 50S ribosomal protein L18 [Patescibacteria group bacterium]
MNKQQQTLMIKKRRQRKIRSVIVGTAERPRFNVSKSNRHFYVQLIDDASGKTLAGIHSREVKTKGNKTETAKAVGILLAEKAKDLKIDKVVFDRGGNRYTGRVRAAAEGAREAGLQF